MTFFSKRTLCGLLIFLIGDPPHKKEENMAAGPEDHVRTGLTPFPCEHVYRESFATYGDLRSPSDLVDHYWYSSFISPRLSNSNTISPRVTGQLPARKPPARRQFTHVYGIRSGFAWLFRGFVGRISSLWIFLFLSYWVAQWSGAQGTRTDATLMLLIFRRQFLCHQEESGTLLGDRNTRLT